MAENLMADPVPKAPQLDMFSHHELTIAAEYMEQLLGLCPCYQIGAVLGVAQGLWCISSPMPLAILSDFIEQSAQNLTCTYFIVTDYGTMMGNPQPAYSKCNLTHNNGHIFSSGFWCCYIFYNSNSYTPESGHAF